MTSPWGKVQHTTPVASGIVFLETASHGGYYLTPDQNERISLVWRKASFNGNGLRGFYEEDCDWSMVCLAFPDLFPPDALLSAKTVFKNFHADLLTI